MANDNYRYQKKAHGTKMKTPAGHSSSTSRRFPTTPRFIIPDQPNLAITRNCYLRIGQVNGHVGSYKVSYENHNAAKFFGSNITENLAWILPKPNFSLDGFPTNTAVTSTFFGSCCNTCFSSGEGHPINDAPRLLILADEHLPSVLGSRGSCLPTLRVESGSFEQLQFLLDYQRSRGFKLKQGSFAIVCLLSHLARVGHSVYWSEYLIFSSWAQRCLNLTVLPAMVPFPMGYSTSSLISFTQLFVNIQAADVGDKSGLGNFKFCLWKAFLSASQNFGAGVAAIPAPPIMVKEAGSLCECSMEFVTGFRGNWLLGPPKHIAAQFVECVISTLKENDVTNTFGRIVLPTAELVHKSLFNARYLGRKIFLLGNSILRNIESCLRCICAESGVETVNWSKGGNFFESFKKLDLSALKECNKDDIIILHATGNSMLVKEQHQLVNGQYHLLHPQLLNDEQAALHVVHLSQVLVKLTSTFTGKIVMIGPFPRHIETCCDNRDHAIVDVTGSPVNMINYTLAVSKYIALSPGLSHEHVHYIEYPAVFGDNFAGVNLTDGVHLQDSATETLSNFVFGLLTKLNKPTSRYKKSLQVQLSSLLSKKNIFNSDTIINTNDDAEDDNINMENGIDTAIKLINQ